MKQLLTTLVTITALSLAFAAQAQDNTSMTMPDSISIAVADSIKGDYSAPQPADTLTVAATASPKKKSLSQKLMEYAKRKRWDSLDHIAEKNGFLRFCVNTYQWADRTFNTYDTAYVVSTGYPWKVMIKEDNWFDDYTFNLENDPNGQYPIEWKGDMSTVLGFSVAFMAVSVGYSFDVSKMSKTHPVDRKVFDFDFCCSRISASMRYINNKANISSAEIEEVQKDYPGVNFSGVTNKIWDVKAYYFFNNYKYSQSAAYNYSKIQRRSAGSPIAGISILLNNVSINMQDPEGILPVLDELHDLHLKSNCYNILAGYGYNWVPVRNLVINATALPSIGWRYGHKTSGEGMDVTRYSFSLNIGLRAGITYNITRRWFLSANVFYHRELYHPKDYSFRSSLGKISFIAGFRF